MSVTLILGVSILSYALACWMMLRSLYGQSSNRNRQSTISLSFAGLALALHFLAILFSTLNGERLDFGLSSMIMVVSAIVVLIFLLGCLGMEISKLGILVFPLTAISLLFSLLWGSPDTSEHSRALLPLSAFSAHVLVSILAYSLVTIATIQSLLYVYHERQFKNRTSPTMLASLPPLQTMEVLLFRLLWISFVLLSLTLLSGIFFSKEIFNQPFEFNHHTVLAVLGWCVFALLLLKRHLSGLRGTQATIWTISGFLLIQLGYFGTKFITESLKL